MDATVRLACSACDRSDKDYITAQGLEQAVTEGWTDIEEVQSYEAACREVAVDDKSGASVFEWWTTLGTCPDCQDG